MPAISTGNKKVDAIRALALKLQQGLGTESAQAAPPPPGKTYGIPSSVVPTNPYVDPATQYTDLTPKDQEGNIRGRGVYSDGPQTLDASGHALYNRPLRKYFKLYSPMGPTGYEGYNGPADLQSFADYTVSQMLSDSRKSNKDKVWIPEATSAKVLAGSDDPKAAPPEAFNKLEQFHKQYVETAIKKIDPNAKLVEDNGFKFYELTVPPAGNSYLSIPPPPEQSQAQPVQPPPAPNQAVARTQAPPASPPALRGINDVANALTRQAQQPGQRTQPQTQAKKPRPNFMQTVLIGLRHALGLD